jgi:hypothetical protein
VESRCDGKGEEARIHFLEGRFKCSTGATESEVFEEREERRRFRSDSGERQEGEPGQAEVVSIKPTTRFIAGAGMWMIPSACMSIPSSISAMFGARAFASAPSWTSQPTEAHIHAPSGSKDDNLRHPTDGCRLSSHSMSTSGQSSTLAVIAIGLSSGNTFKLTHYPNGLSDEQQGACDAD